MARIATAAARRSDGRPGRGRAVSRGSPREWWNPRGKMAPLHKFNPVRLGYIRDQAARAFRARSEAARLPDGPAHSRYRLRRRDPVGAAGAARRAGGRRRSGGRQHRGGASRTPSKAASRSTTARPPPKTLADAGEQFDVVLAMEVVEHVADVPLFVASCAAMVKPGGLMIAATLNRTHEELRAGDRRRRIRPALAAARHASVGQVRHAERARERAWSTAACASPPSAA